MRSCNKAVTFLTVFCLAEVLVVSGASSSQVEFVVPFSDVYASGSDAEGWLDSLVFRYSGNEVRVKYYYPRAVLLVLFQLGDASPSDEDLILIALDLEFDRSEHPSGDDALLLVRRSGSSRSYGGWGDSWREGSSGVRWSYSIVEHNSSYSVFMQISIGEIEGGKRIGFAIGQLNDHEIVDYPPSSSDGSPATWGVFRFFESSIIEEVPSEPRLCRISNTLMRMCYF